MKRVTIFDNAQGNAAGWNPDGASTVFEKFEPGITNAVNVVINIASTRLQIPFVVLQDQVVK
jgi:hypothetical protein